jgi:hypothetical protein
VPELFLHCCTSPAAAQLARLLAEGSLAGLEIGHSPEDDTLAFDAAGAALVADALRVNTTLINLTVYRADLCVDMRVVGVLLGALVGHPSLRKLDIGEEYTANENCGAFGAALAALVAADAPALHVLVCCSNYLRDTGLAPIMEALPLNRHLRELDLNWNHMSEAFARERLLLAVHANTTLRVLHASGLISGPLAAEAALEAQELVRLRWQHD